VVASRRFGSKANTSDRREGSKAAKPAGKFRSVDDVLQTGEVFDHDVVEHMGPQFYRKVFVPAIEQARTKGECYGDIRDAIRKDWTPAKPKG